MSLVEMQMALSIAGGLVGGLIGAGVTVLCIMAFRGK